MEARTMTTVRCPVCGLDVSLPEDAVSGELIEHDCGVVLEVVESGGQFALRVFGGVEEDWGE
ncbi:alpha-aminoadipate/glutamate carrier protein LysW [Aeropyrum camini]|uniref:Lysine biosynthesis protein LysW n=1 Tax=Aeropyrum camini SY1 = JCM 12091 TaxID=1198449 RepID=U3TD88_9CREN|nr:alpha-aminoadipate/glutamate carrier protein LysW [Aeropyrum camini]BAN90391.1 lysine biosynthesis protein LysW [Aeropyrum camini SY1 = JCM 12091]